MENAFDFLTCESNTSLRKRRVKNGLVLQNISL